MPSELRSEVGTGTKRGQMTGSSCLLGGSHGTITVRKKWDDLEESKKRSVWRDNKEQRGSLVMWNEFGEWGWGQIIQ